eukprot:12130603-Karenia_brevis.AAC.1
MMPQSCDEEPPAEINVFSDGSWKNTRHQIWGIGGAGVFWPHRRVEDAPLTDAEYSMAFETQRGDGLGLATLLQGYGGSSTRTEIAGGIVALLGPGPIHLGVDSQAFLQTGLKYQSMLLNNGIPQRPYGCVKDGDLWAYF